MLMSILLNALPENAHSPMRVTEAGIVHEYEIKEEFVVMAISKQTAMEPIHEGRRYLCHTCMNPILYDDEIPNERDSYCPVCGQKIDWKGVKE